MYDVKKYRKENYDFFKEHGICTRCNKEFVEPGKTMCPSCIEKHNKYSKNRYNENIEVNKRMRESNKKRYYMLKESGICTDCGKNKIYKSKSSVRCYECYIKHRRKKIEYNQKHYKHWKEQGLCFKCGGECVDGRTVCADCLKKLQDSAANARKHIQRDFDFKHSIIDYGKLRDNRDKL